MDEYELFLRNVLHFFLQHTLLPAATLGVYHTEINHSSTNFRG